MKPASELENQGKLLRNAKETCCIPAKIPHRDVNLRGTGTSYNIICAKDGESLGQIDGFRAFRETHPGPCIFITAGPYPCG